MVRPWTLPAGCGVLQARSSRSLPSTALISGAPSAGSPNPGYSCALVTVELTTVTARAHQDRRSAGCSNIPTKLRTAWELFRLVGFRRREPRSHPAPEGTPHWHRDWKNQGEALPAPATLSDHVGGCAASAAA